MTRDALPSQRGSYNAGKHGQVRTLHRHQQLTQHRQRPRPPRQRCQRLDDGVQVLERVQGRL